MACKLNEWILHHHSSWIIIFHEEWWMKLHSLPNNGTMKKKSSSGGIAHGWRVGYLRFYDCDCSYSSLNMCQGKWYHSWSIFEYVPLLTIWGREENPLPRNGLLRGRVPNLKEYINNEESNHKSLEVEAGKDLLFLPWKTLALSVLPTLVNFPIYGKIE